MMKRNQTNALLTILMLTITLVGCSDLDELLTFTISDKTDIRIPSSSAVSLPFEILTPDISTNSSQEFQNNNTKAEYVKDVKLQELNLTITNPTSKTFSFLKSIHIYISTSSNDEILLAHMDNISSTAKSIALTPTTEKLDTYAKASSYKLRTSVVTRESLTQDVDIQADLKFKVTADPL